MNKTKLTSLSPSAAAVDGGAGQTSTRREMSGFFVFCRHADREKPRSTDEKCMLAQSFLGVCVCVCGVRFIGGGGGDLVSGLWKLGTRTVPSPSTAQLRAQAH